MNSPSSTPPITDADVVGFFARHLVGLVVNILVENTDGQDETKTAFYSATCIEIDGQYFLLTAGHCTNDISNAYRSPECVAHNFHIVDTYSSEAKYFQAIPFDYDPEEVIQVWEPTTGWDYALIPIREIYCRLLKKNGIVPIQESNWAEQHTVDFEILSLMGFPGELVTVSSSVGESIATNADAVLFGLNLPETPSQDPKILNAVVKENHLNSIVGTSGGPIFGFASLNGQWKFWVVAIQSKWNPKSREISACRVPNIVEHYRSTSS